MKPYLRGLFVVGAILTSVIARGFVYDLIAGEDEEPCARYSLPMYDTPENRERIQDVASTSFNLKAVYDDGTLIYAAPNADGTQTWVEVDPESFISDFGIYKHINTWKRTPGENGGYTRTDPGPCESGDWYDSLLPWRRQ